MLRVRAGAGFGIRRRALSVKSAKEGWDEVTAPFNDVAWFAEHLASFGPNVVVCDPPDLRDAVITRLKGALTVRSESIADGES